MRCSVGSAATHQKSSSTRTATQPCGKLGSVPGGTIWRQKSKPGRPVSVTQYPPSSCRTRHSCDSTISFSCATSSSRIPRLQRRTKRSQDRAVNVKAERPLAVRYVFHVPGGEVRAHLRSQHRVGSVLVRTHRPQSVQARNYGVLVPVRRGHHVAVQLTAGRHHNHHHALQLSYLRVHPSSPSPDYRAQAPPTA